MPREMKIKRVWHLINVLDEILNKSREKALRSVRGSVEPRWREGRSRRRAGAWVQKRALRTESGHP